VVGNDIPVERPLDLQRRAVAAARYGLPLSPAEGIVRGRGRAIRITIKRVARMDVEVAEIRFTVAETGKLRAAAMVVSRSVIFIVEC